MNMRRSGLLVLTVLVLSAALLHAQRALTVNHLGQLPAATISFNLKPGTALGDATKLVEREANRVLPGDIQRTFQGTAQAFQNSFTGMGLLLLAAILVIYIILGILYESFIHPL